MIDILKRIETMRLERNWTEYELSKKAEIPQSTIHAWYRKNQVPALPSLEKLCKAFDISLSVLLSDDSDFMQLSKQDLHALHLFQCLNPKQKQQVLCFLNTLTQEPSASTEEAEASISYPAKEPDDFPDEVEV